MVISSELLHSNHSLRPRANNHREQAPHFMHNRLKILKWSKTTENQIGQKSFKLSKAKLVICDKKSATKIYGPKISTHFDSIVRFLDTARQFPAENSWQWTLVNFDGPRWYLYDLRFVNLIVVESCTLRNSCIYFHNFHNRWHALLKAV